MMPVIMRVFGWVFGLKAKRNKDEKVIFVDREGVAYLPTRKVVLRAKS